MHHSHVFFGAGVAVFSLFGLAGCTPERVSEGGRTTDSGDTATDTDADTDTGDSECGNGLMEGDEQCDDGNDIDEDECTNACISPTCGDGIMQPGEGCDAGADNGPGKPCNSMCQPDVCGDGQIGPGEGCDDGNDIDDDECSNDCTLQSCGNGSLDTGEACDDGNDIDEDECLSTCVMASCGDAILFEQNEVCDEGPQNSDSAACTSACQQAACGDGLVWAGMEACDLGPNNGPMSACLESCVENVCGDGFLGPQEGCDDGNLADDDGCSATCELEDCGDGVVQDQEQCDDGNEDNTDACTTSCHLPACGDGFLQLGEDCDQGNANADDAECTLSCSTAICGDGLIQANVEQCDNGNLNADDAVCKSDCTDSYCGDGFAGPGESCDDGNANNSDACTTVCALATCGDGYVQAGEECDDDNAVHDDGCTNACVLATCGDTIVQIGVDDCDDGNANNTDACLDTCEAATCGDGFVWANNEVCDDGNMQDGDGCDSSCSLSVGVKKITSGSAHTCALFWSGGVKCWGQAGIGSLGGGNTNDIGDDDLPSSIGFINLGGGVAVDLDSGANHNCVLMNNGVLRCWGYNAFGQLGYGHTNNIGDNEGPGGSVSVGANVVAIRLGGHHTCVLTDQQAVRCWGYGEAGQLGYGNMNNIGDNELPSNVGNVSVGGPVASLAAGGNKTCVILVNGDVRCWGSNSTGQLGYGNIVYVGDNELPSSVGPLSLGNTPLAKLVVGVDHSCVLYEDGSMRCWGGNDEGHLGYGNTVDVGDDELPSSVGLVDVGGPVDDISLGYHSTCVRMGTNIKCWGYGTQGSNGYASTAHLGDDELPSSYGPIDLGFDVTQLVTATTSRHHCALSGYDLRCWGRNLSGQLGYGHVNSIGDDEAPSSAGNVSY
jgi:cysteine-rich repeat protein